MIVLGPYTAVSISAADQEWLQLIMTLLLVLLLVIKQVAKSSETPRARILDVLITIPLVPLSMAFIAVVVVRLADLIGR